jgi:polyisoprenoid-binding protein YceI
VVATFESRRITGPREHFTVTGDLTIRGQTREVSLDVKLNGTATNPVTVLHATEPAAGVQGNARSQSTSACPIASGESSWR